MATSLRASEEGLAIIDKARKNKGWTKTEEAWCQLAYCSLATLKRFWMRKHIRGESFIEICEVLGVNWARVVDKEEVVDTSLNLPSQNNSPAKWSLVLSATIDESNKPQVDAIITHLQQILGDITITLHKIDPVSNSLEKH
jgi:hypothetical protein